MSEPNIIDEVLARAMDRSFWFLRHHVGKEHEAALRAALTSSHDQVIEECAKVATAAKGNIYGPTTRSAVATEIENAIRSLKVQPDKGLLEGGSAQ